HVQERQAGVVEIAALFEAADEERTGEKDDSQRAEPEVKPDETRRQGTRGHEARDDVVNRPEYRHREKAEQENLHARGIEPGEGGDFADIGERANSVEQSGDDEGGGAEENERERDIAFRRLIPAAKRV